MNKILIILFIIILADRDVHPTSEENSTLFPLTFNGIDIRNNIMPRKDIYEPNQLIKGIIFKKEVDPKIEKTGRSRRKGLFVCPYCKDDFEATFANIKSGDTKSCGKHISEWATKRATKHGLHKHKLYIMRNDMIQRCTNSNHKHYYRYGGRGIKIYIGWRESFKDFYNWCINNGWVEGLEIDREDNDGNYIPSNCRFVTSKINTQNSSQCKLSMDLAQEIRNAKLLIPEISLRELAIAYNVGQTTIFRTLHNICWERT